MIISQSIELYLTILPKLHEDPGRAPMLCPDSTASMIMNCDFMYVLIKNTQPKEIAFVVLFSQQATTLQLSNFSSKTLRTVSNIETSLFIHSEQLHHKM